jgi:putative transposase
MIVTALVQTPMDLQQLTLDTKMACPRRVIVEWSRDYNEVRPHSSCGRIPSAEFAAQHRINNQKNEAPFNPGVSQ